MPVFEYRTTLPRGRREVFEWFERPGAITRLTPPFSGSVRRGPSDGIRPGSTAVLGIGAPGSAGLLGAAAASMASGVLPAKARPELLWHARHTDLEPGLSFTDTMDRGPLRAWTHRHLFEDAQRTGGGSGTTMVDLVEFELPAVPRVDRPRTGGWTEALFRRELERIFAYRERQLRADLDFHAAHSGTPRTVAVSGAGGTIGTQLCALLAGGGHRVIRLVRRRASGPDEISWDPESGRLDPAALGECDAVVHLSGHPIGGRLTPSTKQKILASRTTSTALLARTLASLAGDGRQRALVVASGIGYYGSHPHQTPEPEPLTEDSPAGHDFLAHVCVAWEEACRPAIVAGVRVANLRTGLVQTPAGGLLPRFLPLFLAGLGGPQGAAAWKSWIGIDDIAAAHAFAALNDAVEGPLNAVAPQPVTGTEYARVLGTVLRRPAAIPVPAFGPRLLLGTQGAHELAEADQRVAPAVLERLGFSFRHRSLEAQLRHVLGRS
ncbi:TIGR01777 family oxidoreductase [Zafaria sp. Z1313]|uniref:TIGR01777 family oxidoreductase n=1 Tax=unclassified Zafaria TaxID=2828765 RepID=UPI002E75FFA9|nr:TIGR01777 family oxidoreductase [Zafaria sp. J156]MEE1622308.1 TIGR01777 family oxidoreductase [Zafaria sp. J156]